MLYVLETFDFLGKGDQWDVGSELLEHRFKASLVW